MIRLALTKGRIENKAVEILEEAGYDCSCLKDKGRKLFFDVGGVEVVLAKAPDVITYVEKGVCDLGIVGKDTIMEHGKEFYELLDLGFGKCRFALAAKKGFDFFGGYSYKTIASKYPNVTKKYFDSLGIDVDVVKIEGSVELAPLLGLSDAIVDIVETGATLKENGLEVIREISTITARLIANTSEIKLKKDEIDLFVNKVELALNNRNNCAY